MNIKLPDHNSFNIKTVNIAGDECVLVTPKEMGVEWTEENKYFRSSVWRKSDMKPVSLGFRKFMNYGEKPQFEPLPENITFRAIQKIDGSCLIVSNYKEELIVRTRGTVDASRLKNGAEIELLKNKYPKAFDNEWLECGLYTLLFEWTTPTNRIVLNETNEPTLWLIGIVSHSNYSYVSQHNLDVYAKEMGVKRPKSFGIRLNGNIEELKKQIDIRSDIEGVVVYDESTGENVNQVLKKIKTLRYLELHRVFTGLKSVDHLFEFWKNSGYLHYYNFKEYIEEKYDHELLVSLDSLLQELFVIVDKMTCKFYEIFNFVNDPSFIKLTRKKQATSVIQTHKEWSWVAFRLLDNPNQDLDWERMYKKYKELNKNNEQANFIRN